MTQRLTQEQLGQIIVEIGQLQQRREAELDPEQVKQILQELNLPPELLDEALLQLSRRIALAEQNKRNRWIAFGVVAALVVAIASSMIFIQQHNSTIAHVQVQQNRITLGQDDGSNLRTISRQTGLEIFYRVTLKDAPLGKKLDLWCDWIDPNGQIVKQNRYQTREINTSVWNTQCRYTINSATTPGNWKVQMLLEGRQIGNTEFEIK
ncbi:MAG: DUF3859 domain-containing protein [Stigonema ocellatum SAG 48.90 = DSM 106950]|nr:DUF3859 domain-containing protein [Stigonema ocellatum SAG 48.90 = DSM 106950]